MMDTKLYRTNTDTTRFLLPLLGFSKEELITDDFINAFKYTINSELKESIIVVYKKPNPTLSELAETVIIGTENYTAYVIEIDKKALELFIEGKYSKLDYLDKQIILKFWGLNKHSRLHNILYPKDFMLETLNFNSKGLLYHKKEIWNKPSALKETFIPRNYVNTTNNGAK